MKAVLGILLFASTLFLAGSILNVNSTYAEECEDIKGEEKWNSEGHDDNSPSESKFNDMIFEDDATTCEVAKAVDHMEAKGEIKEHEYDEFKVTFVYEGTSEEVQECFDDRFNLPDDDGDKHLADYEIQKCATNNY
jgi:hypothetical protein